MVSNTTNFHKNVIVTCVQWQSRKLHYEEAFPYFIVTHVKENFLNDFGNDKGRHF